MKILLTFRVSPHEYQTFPDVFMLGTDYRYQSVNHLLVRNRGFGRFGINPRQLDHLLWFIVQSDGRKVQRVFVRHGLLLCTELRI